MPVTSRDAARGAARLGALRRRARECGALAGVLGSLALAGLALAPGLVIPLLAGALVAAVLSASSALERACLVQELAVDPDAYTIPEVAAYGQRLLRPQSRERMAAWLQDLLAEASLPGTVLLPDRVAEHVHDLQALARDLRSPRVELAAPTLARCRRLLCSAVDSPLYNPNLPAGELASVLRRIRTEVGAGPAGTPR